MQFGQLGSHGCTEFSVQVGQRLVEQEYFGVTDNGTTQRNTLLLTTGQSLRLTVEQVGDVQNTGSFLNAALDLFLGCLVEFQTKGHVLKHRHVRIQSVVLEHHGDLTILRGHIVDQLVTNEQLTLGDLLQTGDHTQGRGLTTTGRADQHEEFLVANLQVKVRDGGDTTGILLVNVTKGYTCH